MVVFVGGTKLTGACLSTRNRTISILARSTGKTLNGIVMFVKKSLQARKISTLTGVSSMTLTLSRRHARTHNADVDCLASD